MSGKASDRVVESLREFFKKRGCDEMPSGHSAALAPLERMLLSDREVFGVFSLSEDYENGLCPISRLDREGPLTPASPMLKFECRGNPNGLPEFLPSLLKHFNYNFGCNTEFEEVLNYADYTNLLQTGYRCGEEESVKLICERWEAMKALIISGFPMLPDLHLPYWNMALKGNRALMYDLLLHRGGKAVRVAQRSCDPEKMRVGLREVFEKNLARQHLGKRWIEIDGREVDDFFSLPFSPRFGGCIAIDVLTKALDAADLLPKKKAPKQVFAPAFTEGVTGSFPTC